MRPPPSPSRRALTASLLAAVAQPPPLPILAAAPPSLLPKATSFPEGSVGFALFEKSFRPKPRALPRRRLNQDFAVLLMRSSYQIADDLDFVPMNEFQRSQFLFRQDEWDEYRKVLPVTQGDLTDPAYFDFISFCQYATISKEMRSGRLLFEEQQDAEGTTVVVNRLANASLPKTNAELPAAHASRVGARILDWMDETAPSLAPKVPPAGSSLTAERLEAGLRQICAILEIEDFCLSAKVRLLPGLVERGAEMSLVAPANLWSGQVLRVRGDALTNDFEVKAALAYLSRCGVAATVETRVDKGGTEVVHTFSWPAVLAP